MSRVGLVGVNNLDITIKALLRWEGVCQCSGGCVLLKYNNKRQRLMEVTMMIIINRYLSYFT